MAVSQPEIIDTVSLVKINICRVNSIALNHACKPIRVTQ